MPAELLARFPDQRVLVLGDALLDAWVTGKPSRLCREGPVPVVDVDGTRYAPGGAGNTAGNAAALGGQVTLVAAGRPGHRGGPPGRGPTPGPPPPRGGTGRV